MPSDPLLPDAARWARIADVFDAIVDLAPGARAEALGRLCKTASGEEDVALRTEVESMLQADEEAQTSADAFDLPSAAALIEADAASGERIGPWRVLRAIGRGGMGRVDLVERADGTYEQQAALKRLSLVAPSRLKRFLRERQILASLQHPGIARLLDGGVDRGAPYLVMEYVDGEPITRYADTHALNLRQRLDLFLQVCDAVAYAHRHLVVHRDLKPSNVLVASGEASSESQRGDADASGARGERSEGQDAAVSRSTSPGPRAGGARVKLLDFGVARLLDPDADEAITQEASGAPMTPGYAAPEQLRGGAITTATDVWSLGVLLYELVSGKRPFEGSTREAWVEAVLQGDPPAPSHVALTRTQEAITAPISRADARRLRGDLDAICLTALRHEPEARYSSAYNLAADLRRYLAREPVEARRPSPLYRIRRFATRHRAATAVALGSLAIIIAGTVFYTANLREARASAEEAAVAAQREANTADRTAEFLESLLADSDPTGADPADRTARQILDAGAIRLRSELADEPTVLASMLATVGRVNRALGRYPEADSFLTDAVGIYEKTDVDPLRHRDALLELANLRYRTETYGEAETFARTALALDSVHARGERSERLAILNTLALVYSDTGRLEASARVLREVIAGRRTLQGEEAEVDLASNLSNLSIIYLDLGRPADAAPLLDESIALTEKHRGPDHPYVAFALNSRSGVRQALGDMDRALADQRRAVRIGETALGADHPFTEHARDLLERMVAGSTTR